jgi:threonine/homoserine/homoserine lactone efflux protein
MATTYLPPKPSQQDALIAAGVFCMIAWLTQPAWIGFGGALRRLLSETRTARLINLGLAALLLVSTLPFLWTHE